MIGRNIAFLSILAIMALFSAANAIEISASVDKQAVGVGDPITLSLVISGKGGTLPEPIMPDLSAFDLYSSGRSQNISIVNGAFNSSLNMTYILVPKKVGEQIIGPIVVNDGAKMASTDPIKITVNQQSPNSGSQPQMQQSQQGRQQGPKAQPPEKSGDFFIDQFVDKTNPYIGEQVTLTFRFYQAVNLWDQPALEWPKYNGVTVEDLVANNRYYENVRGRRYLVTEIKRALFPILAGKITIDTPQLTIKPDDFGVAFDPFGFFDKDLRELFKRGQPKILTANVIALNVRPLPETGKPADFSGAVGRFNLDARVDKDSVGVDEPVTLKLILTGTGNIRSIPPVKLPDLPDFRIYDSGNTESISKTNLIISGTKTFEQAIIPKTSGSYAIPAISFSYFDPSKGTYKTISTSPIDIAATGEGLSDVGGAPKNIIGSGARSLGYIITEFPKTDKPTDLSRDFLFWFLELFTLAGIIAAAVYRMKADRLLRDRGYARRIGANKRSKMLFREAAERKSRGDMEGFYAALYDIVLGYFADKQNLEKAGLTIDQIRENATIPDDMKDTLIRFLEDCQNARFAPGGVETNHADKMIANAVELTELMERVL